ncbi:signal transduction histidine kinase [Stella humosa]|uniref:histidine kinase n=1 Tax=Stella humosa TaxID=94 RepID=A0A3N1KZ26_9PROT|nr:PAS domain-containing sensor histidine kinase [Stella humosa]ROP84672.1 signal transduction histidine kinase [Stella humosa]BBK34192.1 hypothetical protein STHU_48260 [Stella humosa]
MSSSDGSGDQGADDLAPPTAVRFDEILDRVIEAVAVIGPSGDLLYANAVWHRLADRAGEPAAATLARLEALPHFAVRSYPADGRARLVLVRHDEAHVLREAIDHLDSTLAIYDKAERFCYGNAAFHRRYAHHGDDSELIGRTFEELLRATVAAGQLPEPQTSTDPEGYVRRRLAEFRDWRQTDSERLLPSGQWDLLRTRFTPSGLRLTMRTDISAQKRTQDELRRAMERLEVEGAARARFVASLSHDLRTPLSAVLGYAELIETEVMGPLGSSKYHEYAALIRQSGSQLLQLVEGLLEMSRSEAGRGELAAEPVDLSALLRAEVLAIEAQARTGRSQLVLVLPDIVPLLLADPRMVRQMIQALAGNAIRHTPDGAVTISVRQRADGGLDIAVSDTGAGIPPDVLSRLGTPYFQGASPDGNRPAGPGLGLAIVKDLMRLHEGELVLASTPGRGTVATLRFPAGRTPAPTVEDPA